MSTIALGTDRVQPDHHVDEPTPADALVCTLDQAEQWVCDEPARYVVETRYSPRLERTIYVVHDRMEDRFVRWSSVREQAENDALDLNAEDHEPLLIGGLPWFEVGYAVHEWDGPRVSLTRV